MIVDRPQQFSVHSILERLRENPLFEEVVDALRRLGAHEADTSIAWEDGEIEEVQPGPADVER